MFLWRTKRVVSFLTFLLIVMLIGCFQSRSVCFVSIVWSRIKCYCDQLVGCICEDQRRYLTPVSVPFYRDISDFLCAKMKLFSHTTAMDQLNWSFVKNWVEWSVVSIRLRGLELVAGCCEDGDEHVGSIREGISWPTKQLSECLLHGVPSVRVF
jgi:hypothetical protein